MNDQTPLRSPGRNLRARDAVDALRSSVSNAEIMKRFRISALGFADLLRQLFERGLITEQDLVQRGIRYHVVKRESVLIDPEIPEFLPGEDSMQFLDTVELIEILTLPDFPNKQAERQRHHRGQMLSAPVLNELIPPRMPSPFRGTTESVAARLPTLFMHESRS